MPSQYAGRPSGVARMAFRLLESLLAEGDDDYVLRSPWRREDLSPALQASRLEVVVTPRPKKILLDIFSQLITVPALCRRLKIDLVLNIDPFGAAAGGRARVTVVHDLYFYTLQDQVGPRAVATTNLAYRLVLGGSQHVVTVSDATRADLLRWWPKLAGRTRTIRSASMLEVGSAATAAPAHSAPGQPYVLAVGNATPNKNFALLAEAMAGLTAKHPELAIVHVGADPEESIATVLAERGAATPLRRLSGIDDAALEALYRGAACLCVPSLSEGFCLPILEAQSTDCPVICSGVSAMPEIAGEGALLFDPTDADDLARQLERLLSEPGLRQDLILKGRANNAGYSWERAAGLYRQVLREALQGAR